MTPVDRFDHCCNTLAKCLGAERTILLKGQLGELDAVVERKTAAMAALEGALPELMAAGEPHPAKAANAVRRLMERAEANRRALEGALRGLGEARRQVELSRTAGRNLAYGPDGRTIGVEDRKEITLTA